MAENPGESSPTNPGKPEFAQRGPESAEIQGFRWEKRPGGKSTIPGGFWSPGLYRENEMSNSNALGWSALRPFSALDISFARNCGGCQPGWAILTENQKCNELRQSIF